MRRRVDTSAGFHPTVLLSLLTMGFVAGCSAGYTPPESSDTGEASRDSGPRNRDEDRDAEPDDQPDMPTPSPDTAPPEDMDSAETSTDGGSGDDIDDDGGDTSTPDGNGDCVPNRDGVIERSEVTLKPGLSATFKAAQDVEVDTDGMTKANGDRTWNMEKSYPGDHLTVIEFQPMTDKWFAEDFPKADYAMQLADDSEELGVFRTTPDALLLLGVVSPEDGLTTTNIEYDPPVAVLNFPLKEGKSWKTETTASGTHEVWSPTFPATWTEIYDNTVDMSGTLKTPFGSFQVLRVRTVLERKQAFSGLPIGEVRTFSFVAECFGTVATIRSDRGEDEKEFEEAAEIRRLAP